MTTDQSSQDPRVHRAFHKSEEGCVIGYIARDALAYPLITQQMAWEPSRL